MYSSLNDLEKSQGDLANKLGSIQDQHQQDASKLKVQLSQAESRTRDLQKEVRSTSQSLAQYNGAFKPSHKDRIYEY